MLKKITSWVIIPLMAIMIAISFRGVVAQGIVPMADPYTSHCRGNVLLDGDTGLNDWTIYVWDSSYQIVAWATTYTHPYFGAGYYALPGIDTDGSICDDPPHYDITIADDEDVTQMWFRDLHLCAGFPEVNFIFYWEGGSYIDSSCPCLDGQESWI